MTANTTRVINAKRKNIKIVNESFLSDCIACGSIIDATPYLLVQTSETKAEVNSSEVRKLMNLDQQLLITEKQTLATNCNWTKETFSAKLKLNPNRKREIKIFISSTFKFVNNKYLPLSILNM